MASRLVTSPTYERAEHFAGAAVATFALLLAVILLAAP